MKLKTAFAFFLIYCIICQAAFAQVSQEKMNVVYGEIKTPHKYGLIMVPADNEHKMDCPTVFRKGKMWYMTYLIFGGRGYETWLAKSKDLLNWENMGRIMSFSSDTTVWDANQ